MGTFPSVYFDGASQRRRCECGAVIFFERVQYYHFWWQRILGTNNRLETITLWGGLTFKKWLGLGNISVFGDAKCLINQVKDYTLFKPHILSNQMRRMRILDSSFLHIPYTHIYREQNQIDDLLSKRGLAQEHVSIILQHFHKGKS